MAAMVDPGHSSRCGSCLYKFEDENFVAELWKHWSFDDRYVDQEDAVRHADDQRRAHPTRQRFGRSLKGMRRDVAAYFSPGHFSADHAGAHHGWLGRFYFRGTRYQHCGSAWVRQVADVVTVDA